MPNTYVWTCFPDDGKDYCVTPPGDTATHIYATASDAYLYQKPTGYLLTNKTFKSSFTRPHKEDDVDTWYFDTLYVQPIKGDTEDGECLPDQEGLTTVTMEPGHENKRMHPLLE